MVIPFDLTKVDQLNVDKGSVKKLKSDEIINPENHQHKEPKLFRNAGAFIDNSDDGLDSNGEKRKPVNVG